MMQHLLVICLIGSAFCQSGGQSQCSTTLCPPPTTCQERPLPCLVAPCPTTAECVDPNAAACAAVSCITGSVCQVVNGLPQCIQNSQANGPRCDYGNYLPNIFCGRGPNRQDCPVDYFCLIDAGDRFAVCCPDKKKGTCPAVVKGQLGICVEGCSDDSSCTGNQKCCSNGCGHVCMDPVTSMYSNCETKVCEPDQVCEMVQVQCLRAPCPPIPQCRDKKIDTCPAVANGQAGICEEQCSDDSSCTGNQKCCSNGCGHVCMDPMTTSYSNCETKVCEPHQVCEMVKVQCFTTPCPPLPQCRDQTCNDILCRSNERCAMVPTNCGEANCPMGPSCISGFNTDPCSVMKCTAGYECVAQNGQGICRLTNPCIVVKCSATTECVVRDGQGICSPITPLCPNGEPASFRCRLGYCGRLHYCYTAGGQDICCPRGRPTGWWWRK